MPAPRRLSRSRAQLLEQVADDLVLEAQERQRLVDLLSQGRHLGTGLGDVLLQAVDAGEDPAELSLDRVEPPVGRAGDQPACRCAERRSEGGAVLDHDAPG